MSINSVPVLSRAKAGLMTKHIFFASLLLNTPMSIDNTIPTAATDMRRIIYNEKFIESLTTPVAMFVVVHEVMHIMFKHGLRRGTREPQLWNIACDYAINLLLKTAGFSLWPHCYCDDRFKGMSAEQVYDIIRDEREERKRNGKSTPADGDPCDGGFGEPDLIEPENMTEAEKAAVEATIQQNVAQAFTAAKMAGQMPAGLDVLVGKMLHPPAPWQEYLTEYMTTMVKEDESWSRRNRRYHDAVLPTPHSEAMGEIVIIGDTSSSMHGYFGQIAGEINEIVSKVKPSLVRVIWADDTDVAHEETFEPGEEITLHPKGGGGTDMRKPLRYVEKFDPELVLLITDGHTPWVTSVPYPLIIACNTNQPIPDIGRVVRLAD
jgi:predicted metal-dependent peptidase